MATHTALVSTSLLSQSAFAAKGEFVQELAGPEGQLDVSHLPTILVEPRSRPALLLIGALGAAALATCALSILGLTGVLPGSVVRWLPMLTLQMTGLVLIGLVARRLTRRRSMLFEADKVSVLDRDVFGQETWSQPYSAFRGVQVRTVAVGSRTGPGRRYHRIELDHAQPRRGILLGQFDASTTSRLDVGTACARFAATFQVPIVSAHDRGLQRLPIVGHLF